VPGIGGSLLLDPTQMVTTLTAGVVPASGSQSFAMSLPLNAAIAHSRFHLQAVHGGSAWDFTNGLFFPILP
jgi:hypothetical protein